MVRLARGKLGQPCLSPLEGQALEGCGKAGGQRSGRKGVGWVEGKGEGKRKKRKVRLG